MWNRLHKRLSGLDHKCAEEERSPKVKEIERRAAEVAERVEMLEWQTMPDFQKRERPRP